MFIKFPFPRPAAITLLSALLLTALSFSSCKKDDTDDPVELPELGTCESVTPQGHLTEDSIGVYTFRTNGGGTISINNATFTKLTHDDYPGFKLEYWGTATTRNSGNHENLNGKHIKDRIDKRRTIIFPDGAKITFIASGFAGDLLSISIYDGDESHHINAACNSIEHSSTDAAVTQALDAAEADGEAGGFEFTSTGLMYFNSYMEDVAGDKVQDRYNLGEIFTDQANTVRDHYDDPRLGHT